MPGMLDEHGNRYVAEGRYPRRSVLPDLTDPATLGALLALVREAWGDDRVSSVANTVYGTRMILMPDDAAPEGERLIGCSTTEAEALVIALEAAP
jgi:hypothetical protein